jgi:hypothetical protein
MGASSQLDGLRVYRHDTGDTFLANVPTDTTGGVSLGFTIPAKQTQPHKAQGTPHGI